MHLSKPSIWTLLRYPHPPLNQSSYTIFSFHRLAGFLPHPVSYFFGESNNEGTACRASAQGAALEPLSPPPPPA